jgi:uncharacterized protein YbaR (Trm112 family)
LNCPKCKNKLLYVECSTISTEKEIKNDGSIGKLVRKNKRQIEAEFLRCEECNCAFECSYDGKTVIIGSEI